MVIFVKCHGCKREYRVPDHAGGKKAKCAGCSFIMRIPFQDAQIDEDRGVVGRDEVPIESSKAMVAFKKRNIMAGWEGMEGRWIKGIPMRRPGRFLWAAQGGYLNSFFVSIYKKSRRDTVLRPVSEHHLDGSKEGSFDIVDIGSLSLNVNTGGPPPVRWVIVVLSDMI